MPDERKLTNEENEELTVLLQEGLERLVPSPEDVNVPEQTVCSIHQFIDETRVAGYGSEKLEEISFRIGALWGDQFCRDLDWQWVHLGYGDEFDGYAVVSPNRAFVCFPMHLVYKILINPQQKNTTSLLFSLLRSGNIPQMSANSYTLVG